MGLLITGSFPSCCGGLRGLCPVAGLFALQTEKIHKYFTLFLYSHKSPVHSAAPGAGLVNPGPSASRQTKLDICLH